MKDTETLAEQESTTATSQTTNPSSAPTSEPTDDSDANLHQIPEITLEDIVLDDVGEDLESAYDKNTLLINEGQILKGKVARIEPHEVLLDIGYKSEGVVPLKELAVRQDVHPQELVSVGEEIETVVIQKEDREGRLVLSKKQAQYEKVWLEMEESHKNNVVISGVAIEVVKGGLIVDIGLRGFLPASLVDLRRVSDLDQYMGQEIKAKILELDRNRNNIVLSRRAWLEESHKEEREELMVNLMPGDIKKGIISSVVAFGAFVDLGGMDGLVHVSEISWKHIEHPSEVISVGDEVEVRILGVDTERERIALSIKATQQGPWAEFAETHNVGELVYGRVTKLVPFGAFIQVGEDIEGLVHISELSSHRIESPAEVISPGEELWVKIVEIDVSKRRISLSVKQALEGGEVASEYQADFQEYSSVEGDADTDVAAVENDVTVDVESDVVSEDVASEDASSEETASEERAEATTADEAGDSTGEGGDIDAPAVEDVPSEPTYEFTASDLPESDEAPVEGEVAVDSEASVDDEPAEGGEATVDGQVEAEVAKGDEPEGDEPEEPIEAEIQN